jgi:hypothetical protein
MGESLEMEIGIAFSSRSPFEAATLEKAKISSFAILISRAKLPRRLGGKENLSFRVERRLWLSGGLRFFLCSFLLYPRSL